MAIGRVIRVLVIDPVTETVLEKLINPQRRKIAEILGGKPESIHLGAFFPGNAMWLLAEDLWPESPAGKPKYHGLPLWGFSDERGALDVPLFGYAIVHGIRGSQPASTTLMCEDVARCISWPNA